MAAGPSRNGGHRPVVGSGTCRVGLRKQPRPCWRERWLSIHATPSPAHAEWPGGQNPGYLRDDHHRDHHHHHDRAGPPRQARGTGTESGDSTAPTFVGAILRSRRNERHGDRHWLPGTAGRLRRFFRRSAGSLGPRAGPSAASRVHSLSERIGHCQRQLPDLHIRPAWSRTL